MPRSCAPLLVIFYITGFTGIKFIKAIRHKQQREFPRTSAAPSALQLAVSGLDRLLAVLSLEASDLSTLPAKSSEALGEDRVRVVVAGVHPVSIHGAQVLNLQLEQRRSELVRES